MSQSKAGKSRRRLSYVQKSCELCNGQHRLMSSPQQWTSQTASELALSLGVSLGKQICQPCRSDITRMVNNPSYKPRWEKSRKVTCCVLECIEDAFASSRMATMENMVALFTNANLRCSSDTIPVPTPLCTYHYHLLYNQLHPTQTNCSTCGSSLKHANPRPCPKPSVIQSHLTETAGFEGQINPGDKVCYTCYKSQLVILQENKQVSRDSALLLLINTFKQNATDANELTDLQGVVNAAVNQTTVMVAEELLQKKIFTLTLSP